MPKVDLPRHSSMASSLDDCDSGITRISASEATVERAPAQESIELLTNVSADAPEYKI